MKRFFSLWIAVAAGLAALSSSGISMAASGPEVPPAADAPAATTAAEAPAVVAAPEASAPPVAPPAAAPPPPAAKPAPRRASSPAGGVAERGSARDAYGGPPLLLGGGRKIKVGAYAGMGGAYTRLMGRASGLVSFEGALLLDHRLSLGLAAYGFTRTPRGPNASDGTRQELAAGYGGLALRYSVFGDLPVYGTFGLVLGAGAINLHHDHGWDDETDWDRGFRGDDDEWERGLFDPFLFAQPELTLNANATRWLRFGATVGYRFTGGVGRFGLGEQDLNGVVLGGNVQLGWF